MNQKYKVSYNIQTEYYNSLFLYIKKASSKDDAYIP